MLGTIGVATLTKVKHKRELLFASLPALFAVHQLIEGFVWLGLDGVMSPAVTHKMAAAFVLYAQGLLPFVIPLSVLLFEPTVKSRRRMLPFLAIGTGTSLYMLWALIAYALYVFVRGDSRCRHVAAYTVASNRQTRRVDLEFFGVRGDITRRRICLLDSNWIAMLRRSVVTNTTFASTPTANSLTKRS